MAPPPINDATIPLQQAILRACEQARKSNPTSPIIAVSLKLEKGDYAIQAIQIPKSSYLTLYSKDNVRILYIGKRNRPMFILEDNSTLILREKLEIYYNCNNIHEAMKLMIRRSSSSLTSSDQSSVDISKGVKISLFSQKTE